VQDLITPESLVLRQTTLTGSARCTRQVADVVLRIIPGRHWFVEPSSFKWGSDAVSEGKQRTTSMPQYSKTPTVHMHTRRWRASTPTASAAWPYYDVNVSKAGTV
jgi:hypothetical protein